MISGATHTLSPNLQQAQTDYRAQLEAQQAQSGQVTSEPANPVEIQPVEVPETEPTGSTSTLGEIEVASHDLQDQARQEALFNADPTRPEQGNQEMSEPVDPVSTQPADPEESPPLFVAESEQPEQTTAEKIEETSQDIRDQSRNAAVQAFEIQNAQLQVDTYVNASSDNDDDVSTQTIGPAQAYEASMKYGRQDALLNADVTRPEQGNQDISEPVDPVSTQPVDPVTSQPVEPEESPPLFVAESEQPEQTTAEKIEETSQDIRDQSRQAAVHAFEMQNAQLQVDTYVNASSNGDNDDVSTQTIDPAKAYETSMKYGRQEALLNAADTNTQTIDPADVNKAIVKYGYHKSLMSAFEKAAQGESTGSQLNVVI